MLFTGIKALEYKFPQTVFAKYLPRLFHSCHGVAWKGFLDYFDTISGYLNVNRFKIFSFDLGPAVSSTKTGPNQYPAGEPIGRLNLRRLIKRRIRLVRSRFKGLLAMENLNYFPIPAYSHVCEPDFIDEVIRENDTYLVLDIAHALISARNLGMDAHDYLSMLPLDRVIEIHISSPRLGKSSCFDKHGPPCPREYRMLEKLRNRLCNEFYLVIEYYRDFAQLRKIYRKLHTQ